MTMIRPPAPAAAATASAGAPRQRGVSSLLTLIIATSTFQTCRARGGPAGLAEEDPCAPVGLSPAGTGTPLPAQPEGATVLLRQLAAFGPGSRQASPLEGAMGRIYASTGQFAVAVCHFERALAATADVGQEEAEEEQQRRAELKEELARALLQSGRVAEGASQLQANTEDLRKKVRSFLDQGYPQKAVELLEGEIQGARATMGAGKTRVGGQETGCAGRPAIVAILMADLGEAQALAGNSPAAIATLEGGLREPCLRKAALGQDEGRLARYRLQLQLGQVRHALGELDTARRLYGEAIQEAEELPTSGGGSERLAAALQLAQLDCDSGRYAEAQAAVASVEKALREGPDGRGAAALPPLLLGRARRLHSDLLQRFLGREKEALQLGREALQLHLEALGETAPEVAQTAKVLGNAYLRVRDASGALEAYKIALDANKRTFGPRHVTTAISHSYVGRALDEMGQRRSAGKHLSQAVEIMKVLHRDPHHQGNTLDESIAYTNYAAHLWEMGNPEEAIKVQEAAHKLFSKHGVAPTAPRYKSVLDNLAFMREEYPGGSVPEKEEPFDMLEIKRSGSSVSIGVDLDDADFDDWAEDMPEDAMDDDMYDEEQEGVEDGTGEQEQPQGDVSVTV